MTPSSPGSPDAGDDQRAHEFGYGHGRMPLFMKIVWISFLAFATWYVVQFLLTAVGVELGA
jgi:hypothetical protein